MSEAELQATIESTQRLKKMQETPDPPEALAAIPSLTLADLEREVKTIPLEMVEESETRILYSLDRFGPRGWPTPRSGR